MEPAAAIIEAEAQKVLGNKEYKRKEFEKALEHYSKAIDLRPRYASYLDKRAACYLSLRRFQDALADTEEITRVDPSFIRAHFKAARCHMALGDGQSALAAIRRVESLDPASFLSYTNRVEGYNCSLRDGRILYERREYRRAISFMDRAIRLAGGFCTRASLVKAECLMHLKMFKESSDVFAEIGNMDEATYARGLFHYYQGDLEKAVTQFQQLVPGHERATRAYRLTVGLVIAKEEGNAAYRSGRCQEACEFYTRALGMDPTNDYFNAKLFFNRAVSRRKLKYNQLALDDSNRAIRLKPDYLKAIALRGQLHLELEMYEKSVRDFEIVFAESRTRANYDILENAKKEMKRSRRKDHYKVLGVSEQATLEDIKRAYKKKALIFHPDRHSGEAGKIENEAAFKEISAAYGVLSDERKRYRYDSELDGGPPMGTFEHLFQNSRFVFRRFY